MYFCAKIKASFHLRYFIQLSYNGTPFHGWQIQPNANSVQQTLNESLGTILREAINIVGAGRTDTGVHAKEMFAHFDWQTALETKELAYKLNRLLPPQVAVQNIIRVADEAHARFDATARSYEYQVTFAKNPFATNLAWRINHGASLNFKAMEAAAEALVEYEDFGAFARSNNQSHTNLCDIKEVRFEFLEKGFVFHITANRFLRNMVRAIMGTLIQVGLNKLDVNGFREVIESKNRANAGESAPAHGLYLTRVTYPQHIFNV